MPQMPFVLKKNTDIFFQTVIFVKIFFWNFRSSSFFFKYRDHPENLDLDFVTKKLLTLT